ncbi:Protein-export membrane protein SecD [Pseudonocardia sp. Ae168_Ps1]|uniref:protein translocase subunit SecD n=1 Tax=unclassified Pseudonocardia TaxID=2619320 RepID=UPI00094B4180|nr:MULTISPECIES: protein translocase subunit SecD [unclassified Pseudonocardia]OLL72593.1 Protein-export membrane protein SecD [Pseudonocardia sp. Ae150A_Ps1]OLL78565.1 Protein-export membrane protein SecD [Pseudonocardia sp. Ae168_Ps1]OLL87309.1 Protein-export membrane protein SecD [Pseudonocardia sp. Ae263_Ps1]OLL92661.1 Protein-export membrane protein SecD [Pseudonocardia sp. Ae356_Ps1]
MATSSGQQRVRPWRYLTAFLGIVVILYTLVLFTGGGNLTPKLGIDLQGGTRVTLTARAVDGQPPPRDQLVQAESIIEQRVNGLGVSGAEVQLDGSNIVITVPGDQGEQARSLGQTAQLRFREVVEGPIPADPAAQQQPAPGGQPAPGAQPGQEPAGAPAGQAPAAPQPQGMGAPGEQSRAVAPVAQSSPLQDPPPAPEPPGPTGAATPTDPRVAAEVEQLRATRQSSDQATQVQALLALNCAGPDPLQGYDDPAQPLVTCGEDGTTKYILGPSFLEGTEIASAQPQQSQGAAGWAVGLTFKPQGAETWGQYTTANVGKNVAFVLDGDVVSAPSINQPIYGQTQISGQFNQECAQDLAQTLRYGSLPLAFDPGTAQTVSATLGLASLEAGLIAGAVGLALVFVYCLFYYRLLGLLTILSLVLSGVVVYAVLILLGRWIGFTLDLAGVAGFIIAIGITADSFVIFFERLKDEMREGRTFRSAVPRSWERARRTILTADAVSFLAAAVLYILAVGEVRGFAFTLGMSTVLDLVVVFLVTFPLVVLISRSKSLGRPGLSGLAAVDRIGARHRRDKPAVGQRATSGKGAGA